MRLDRLTGLAAAGLLTACAVGPDYERPELEMPEAWPDQAVLEPVADAELQQWWRVFGDPVLDELVERALGDNLELRIQVARVEEARARLGLARAEQLPTVDLQAEASRERQPAAAFGIEGFDAAPRTLFSVSGLLGYEIDLWGRLAREREAAAADLEASVYAGEAVRLGLIADVVVTYAGLRSAQRQLRVTERTVAARQESVRVRRLRYEAGAIGELELRQAESSLASARAELPARIEELRGRESALGILLGMPPAVLFTAFDLPEGGLEKGAVPETIPVNLPADLLRRRPDLRAAESELKMATAAVGVAAAARLPRLALSGLIGTAAADSAGLFSSEAEAWRVGAGLDGPLFDFGRARARFESAEARLEAADLRYRATVAVALAEVRDALAFYESSGQRLEAVEAQIRALRRTEELAEIRYEAGYISIIELLDAQRALLAAELAQARALADRYVATATLFKALGGGWEVT
ncbi:efflux transporter outer membrane subunit [Wenzhouxiangella sp. XN24]|uniref:efflux transporter outer membrane subunit n=1 Tax=Wenzhouxiangella sp. XN24 TaxID=2713569 RepID=UPI0013EDA47E|nr:efflux transporter outer membrane subunit [Wenzhouxiangella sp. XN24]NGX15368.1 efflux transporter outer membrane subunit [Wenzhouxiangella sp. XN24]